MDEKEKLEKQRMSLRNARIKAKLLDSKSLVIKIDSELASVISRLNNLEKQEKDTEPQKRPA